MLFQGVNVIGAAMDVLVDRLTRALAVMTSDHLYIHEGIAFTAVNFYTNVANNATVYMQIKTPATGPTLHFKPALVTGDGKAEIRLQECASIVDGAGAVAVSNRNRRSTVTSQAFVKTGATSVVEAALLDGAYLPGGGNGSSKIGGSVEAAEEHVLKPATSYVVAIKNVSGASSNYCISAFWYEEDGY